MQVNYRYVLDEITMNNQAYMRDREIAVSSKVAEAVNQLAVLWR